MEIREEKTTEQRETENVVREAFWNVYAPGCSEHFVLHVLRNSPAFVPQLNLVAVEKGKIMGHVAVVRGRIEGDDGNRHEVLTLGPISVLPKFQQKGIGTKLITEVKHRAKEMGYTAILLCGNPAFYTRVGFVAAEKYCIRNSENMFMDALLACELKTGALENLAGRYYEDATYMVEERDVLEFDKAFPSKPKISGNASQKLFMELCTRCKPYVGK